MKKRKYLALLLAAGMIAQTALSTGGVVQVQAAEDTYVKTDELTDNDTAAPKKDSVIPSKNQYEYQKQELAAFCHFGMNTYTGSEWGNGKENPNQFQLTNDFDEETLTTINKFFENSLNVSETSRQLYIHRNTLVYRLDKLQKSTGLDLRVFEDAITFKIALMVVKYMKYMETLDY